MSTKILLDNYDKFWLLPCKIHEQMINEKNKFEDRITPKEEGTIK